MRPKLHLIASLVLVWGGTLLLTIVCVIAWNSLALSGVYLLLFGALILLTRWTLQRFIVGCLPANCPQCGARCEMLTKREIHYRCGNCDFYWNAGVATTGSNNAGGWG